MGSVTAIGLADTTLDLETQLLYHLKGNHYPPVPAEMVKPCIEAIDAYYDKDYPLSDKVIVFPSLALYLLIQLLLRFPLFNYDLSVSVEGFSIHLSCWV